MSKYFLEITIGGPCKHFGGQIWAATALSGTKTVTVKLSKKAGVNLTTLPLGEGGVQSTLFCIFNHCYFTVFQVQTTSKFVTQ